jgi:hypothetical protein
MPEVLTVNIPKELGDKLRAGAKRRLMAKATFARQILLDAVEQAERSQVAGEIGRETAVEVRAEGNGQPAAQEAAS